MAHSGHVPAPSLASIRIEIPSQLFLAEISEGEVRPFPHKISSGNLALPSVIVSRFKGAHHGAATSNPAVHPHNRIC
jgi:hypothetical protein